MYFVTWTFLDIFLVLVFTSVSFCEDKGDEINSSTLLHRLFQYYEGAISPHADFGKYSIFFIRRIIDEIEKS